MGGGGGFGISHTSTPVDFASAADAKAAEEAAAAKAAEEAAAAKAAEEAAAAKAAEEEAMKGEAPDGFEWGGVF